MKTVHMVVMIAEPNKDTYTLPVRGTDVEHCMSQLHEYLDSTTEPGTRCEVVFCGYKGERDEVI